MLRCGIATGPHGGDSVARGWSRPVPCSNGNAASWAAPMGTDASMPPTCPPPQEALCRPTQHDGLCQSATPRRRLRAWARASDARDSGPAALLPSGSKTRLLRRPNGFATMRVWMGGGVVTRPVANRRSGRGACAGSIPAPSAMDSPAQWWASGLENRRHVLRGGFDSSAIR